jgi:hypothetical protein
MKLAHYKATAPTVLHHADAVSGDFVGIDHLGNNARGVIFVPEGYVSDAALSDSMTFNNASLIESQFTWVIKQSSSTTRANVFSAVAGNSAGTRTCSNGYSE